PTGDSVGGRLKTEDPWTLEQYGKYIASWVAGWNQRYNVPLYAVSLQNESTFENPFNSMTFMRNQAGGQDFNQYAMGLKSVKDAWDLFGLETKIKGPHVAHFNASPGNPFGLWWQNEMIAGVKNHPDAGLIGFLDFYNANYYNGTSANNNKNVLGFWLGWQQVVPGEWGWHRPPGVAGDGKPVWFSETGDGGGGTWTSQITTPLKMHNALVYGQGSAYIYWQFADGGGLSQHNLLAESQVTNPLQSKKYAAFKQFSRHVRPGARRVAAEFPNGWSTFGTADPFNSASGLNASAFVHEEDERVTVVLVNMRPNAETVDLVLGEGPAVSSFEVFRTSATESYASLAAVPVTNGQATLTVPARSVVTLSGSFDAEPVDEAMLWEALAAFLGLEAERLQAGQVLPVEATLEGGNWVLRFEQAAALAHGELILEWSDDLETWHRDGLTVETASGDGGTTAWTVSRPVGAEDRFFFRFRVEG
ncbi:MAG: hypothetical protein EA425_01415, partial [Puniceicoccaceae bacterium]